MSDSIKIFYSWQSDLPNSTNRGFIKRRLDKAVKQLMRSEVIDADRIEVDQDTQGVPGSPDIAKTIFGKIETADIFIADVTPIVEIPTKESVKSIPNPNVMVELGHALAHLGDNRVILVINDALWNGDNNTLPFDFRFRKISTRYSLLESASKDDREAASVKLERSLIKAIETIIIRLPAQIPENPSLPKFSVSPFDDGVWNYGDSGIQLSRAFDGPISSTFFPAQGAKIFGRIIPSTWSNGKPVRTEFRRNQSGPNLELLGRWSSLDYGPNNVGYIAFEPPTNQFVSNATQWIKQSGEVSGFSTKISSSNPNGLTQIFHEEIIRGWNIFLKRNVEYLEFMGANGPYFVDFGVTELQNSFLRNDNHFENFTNLDATVRESGILSSGSNTEISKFISTLKESLADAYGAARGAFKSI